MTDIAALTREAFRRRDAGDLDGFLELLHPDCTWTAPGAALRGGGEIRAYVAPFYEAFSDGRHELAAVESAGERAYAQGCWRATHSGPLPTPQGEVPPTGAPIELRFAIVVEAGEDGLVRSVDAYWDSLSLLEQLRPAEGIDPGAVVLEAFRRMDAGDVDGLVALAADDVVWEIPGAVATSPAELAALITTYVTAFPDGRHEPVRLETIGDTALVEGFWSGTHTGPLGDVPATGASVRFRFCGVLEVRDGRIASVHNYFDRLELMERLGPVPEPAVA
jgi:steroid delta-isomerase-like uncharacterized protein/uncharacterized protein (TIGR02246 family)